MAQVELLDDRLVIRNTGLRRLLTVAGTITIRYEAIERVEVGLDAVPTWFAWRVGYNPGLGTRRAGIFWWRGKKWFLDVDDLANALVLHLKPGAPYGAVAVSVPNAAELAAEIRSRSTS